MPVIVVGADTEPGRAIVERLHQPGREIRVFVSNETAGQELRQRGCKVATGDVSDESHIEGAATRCFSAVLITEAATDDRERSFASTPEAVWEGWARAISNSKVRRVIWVSAEDPPATQAPEVVRVDPATPGFVDEVFRLDETQRIT